METNVQKLSNMELYKKYNGQRGSVASEMCRRAGTINYLLEYATFDDERFVSCMRDTIEVFEKKLLKNERKYASS